MSVGFVAIGRNEGDRLKACLRSCVREAGEASHVVYVDSGSTDGSVAFPESLGVTVVDLDTSVGFTAARARNAGWRRLLDLNPDCTFVQFLDGDCELRDGWIDTARHALENNEQLAVVCGRRRERFPEASIYNRLCDMEWDTPVGEAKYCGGDALMRVAALREVGGYDDSLIAGEEPELCVRLRMAGWSIERVDAEMTWHDAAMTRFGQFWKRSVRAGHAYAEGNAKHGGPPMFHWDKEVKSIGWWGATLPALIFLLSLFLLLEGVALISLTGFTRLVFAVSTLFLVGLVLLYPVLLAKVWKYRRSLGDSFKHSLLYAASVVVGKFANASGVRMYRRNRKAGKRGGLIEYKASGGSASVPAEAGTPGGGVM